MFAAQRVQREIQPQAGQASTGAYPRRFKNEALFAASQAFLDGGDQWLADPLLQSHLSRIENVYNGERCFGIGALIERQQAIAPALRICPRLQ